MVDEDFPTVTSTREHASSVSMARTFRISSKLVDFSTSRAWHNSLACNGNSVCDIHIKTSMPSFDLFPGYSFIRDKVAV